MRSLVQRNPCRSKVTVTGRLENRGLYCMHVTTRSMKKKAVGKQVLVRFNRMHSIETFRMT